MSKALGRISESFIQDLLSRIDLLELIGERVSLRKAGSHFIGLCPFHKEKTPSFTVHPQKQFYHCFGCGASGDAIEFLRQCEHDDFVGVLETLCQRVGLTLPNIDSGEANLQKAQLAPVYEVLTRAAQYYYDNLSHPAAQPAVGYLKKRGIDGKTAKMFQLGYALPGWDHLISHMGEEADKEAALVQAGLIILKPEESKRYDRFRDRILFPIRDYRGRVIGFGGRVLDDSLPKYLNSPETVLFHKGETLYGWYETIKTHKAGPLYVVEGYMDVVGLYQHGIFGAVATLGTAVTSSHIQKILKRYQDVVFCFDGDNAGRQAAWKACQTALPFLVDGCKLSFVFLPEKTDPDSFVKTEGKDAFLALAAKSKPLSDYLFQELAHQVIPDSIDGRARYVKLARPLLEELPNGIFREMMFEQLAVIAQMRNPLGGKPVKGRPGTKQQGKKRSGFSHHFPMPPRAKPLKPAEFAAILLCRYPDLIASLEEAYCARVLNQVDSPLLNTVIDIIRCEQACECGTIYEGLENRGYSRMDLDRMALSVANVPEKGAQAELFGAFTRLEAQNRLKITEELLAKAKINELSPEEKRLLKENLQN